MGFIDSNGNPIKVERDEFSSSEKGSEKSYPVLVSEEVYTRLHLAKYEYLRKEKKSISIKKLLDLYFEGDELVISLLQKTI